MKLLGSIDTPLVVAAISGNVINNAALASELGADVVEIRLDLLDSTSNIYDNISYITENFSLPVIITNRLAEESGGWKGSELKRVELLTTLMPLSDAVDIELKAPLRDVVINKAKELDKIVIVSAHDFVETKPPAELASILKEERRAGGDISKLAVTPHSSQDVLNLLQAGVASRHPVCTIAMGELGKHTRIIAGLYGSVLTYASVEETTAPGQLRVNTVKKLIKLFYQKKS
ncbi:MAG: type I 3-dehydroquinate dehydratase [Methanosarcinales archaeon]|nr:MAG: type I 3-dehydroquinate dehydratase [Methanosarcinales archaeon]